MELTLMAQTLRPLPLAPLRRALGQRLALAMRRLPPDGVGNPWRVRRAVHPPARRGPAGPVMRGHDSREHLMLCDRDRCSLCWQAVCVSAACGASWACDQALGLTSSGLCSERRLCSTAHSAWKFHRSGLPTTLAADGSACTGRPASAALMR